MKGTKIAVVGLGYVGLPAAMAFAEEFGGAIGYDADPERIAELRDGVDRTGGFTAAELWDCGIHFTEDPGDLAPANLYIVAVPTPIDEAKRPDLSALRAASATVGAVLGQGDVVVYESTVYPGATEEVCAPILARTSGLLYGKGFFVGYSPERINPGDRVHTFDKVVKVVAGQDPATTGVIAKIYERVVKPGVYRASSIAVAEASKVVENVQRDVNIAFVNELALLFGHLGIDTLEVLEAAGSKWNFLPFRPGLVGGHCIGVDPYYLVARAQERGYTPQLIAAAREVNEGMGAHVAQVAMKDLGRRGKARPTVGVLGLAFKEDVRDLRNSRVPEIVAELESFGARVLVHDFVCDGTDAKRQYGIELVDLYDLEDADALVLAVPHVGMADGCVALVRENPGIELVVDVKGAIPRGALPEHVRHWRL